MEVSGHFKPEERGPRYPLDRRLGGTQSWHGRGSEKENITFLPLPGIESRFSNPLLSSETV